MSWTDIFPVLSDSLVIDYQTLATTAERLEMEEWLGVEKIFPARRRPSEKTGQGRRRRHLVSATLFWKHVQGADPDLPVPSRERLVMAKRLGLVKRFSPWTSYVEPLMDWSARAVERHPDVAFRLYLARDLEFLVPDLTELGWEVHLMKSSSLRYCPGGFWRFLALGERGKCVTVIDTDRMNVVDGEIARTKMMDEMGLGLWRVPGYYGVDNDRKTDRVRYRPILGGHFGGVGGLPVRELIEAFIWHARRGTLPEMADMPGR